MSSKDRNYEYSGKELHSHVVMRSLMPVFVNILEKLNIKYWLAWGSLLGAVRNEKMIPWDYDIDFGYFQHDINKLLSYREKAEKEGYFLKTTNKGNIVRFFGPEGYKYHIDIFAWYKDGQNYKLSYKPGKRIMPINELLPLRKIMFEGMFLPCPGKPVETIKRWYGEDWWIKKVYKENIEAIKLFEPDNEDIINEINKYL